ncbi:MAG: GtrA family protein [Steroidobacteraceae bacterium]
MRTVVQEAIGYTVVSGCALLVDMTILWVLVHYFSWWYLLAATTSFSAGLLVAYAFSVKLVFQYRRLRDRRLEFASFASIGGVGVVINAAVISFGIKCLGLHFLIAKCAAAGFTFAWNFVARRQFLFVQRRALEDRSA